MHILLVDDSDELLLLLSSVLKRLGCEVSCASNIPDAKKIESFDLVLVDWNLADGLGIDLLEAFSARAQTGKMILMSATKPDEKTQERLSLIGATYEPKPITPMMLKQMVSV